MKVSIPVWNHRISPVFDAATRLLVITVENKCEAHRMELEIEALGFYERVQKMEDLAIDVLLCGAISKPMENAILAKQIQVLPYICGDVDEILHAFLSDQLLQSRYAMPGCCSHRRLRTRQGKASLKGKGCPHENSH